MSMLCIPGQPGKFADGGIWARPESAIEKRDIVLLNELARHLKCLGRHVSIVQRQQLQLPAIDAALLVEHFKKGEIADAIGAGEGNGAAVGHRLAHEDFRVGNARAVVFCQGASERTRRHRGQNRRGRG